MAWLRRAAAPLRSTSTLLVGIYLVLGGVVAGAYAVLVVGFGQMFADRALERPAVVVLAAGTLYLGVETVRTHVGNVLAKLGVRDRTQAVVRGDPRALTRREARGMTTEKNLPSRTGPRTGVAERRSRAIENVTLAWWAAGAAFAVVDALAYRASVGAAVMRPEAINHGFLADVPPGTMSFALALFALLGAVVAAGVLVLVDATVLAGLGYLPALLVMAPFSAEVRDAFGVYVEPGFAVQVVVLVGAVLLAVAVARFARRTSGACETCGRRHDGHDPAWTRPAAAARWGRVAALVAAAIPAFYGVTRLAWALGIPLGMARVDEEGFTGIELIGPIGLGTFSLVGAVLTLGLFQRWGEVFPRWMVGLAGRRVPVGLAVVPASIVAVAVLPAGISVIAMGLQRGMLTADEWGATGPAILWPVWSVALGAATYAYWLRRRGTCRVCGRG
ncbi:regulatory protein LuxR [Isoptericola variabilis]|uniref:Regulatory protein LuxR n=1 Tax=Isoptericola variabilis (strain 225) TaxID=743718 RepID=F6FQS2_ISOV2|nr:regulatory protein LuxR [Isoptericola variabilis]AEG42887.1 regulatory protein LuxR [Isoptericola variabilis 225]TWH30192.1 hypothetical protein L600_003100000100 [Isoptericola variabilis J7]